MTNTADTSNPADPGAAALRREPGQVVTAAYRERGALRYTAVDRAILGRNGIYFNNRPLYCPAATGGVVLAGDRPLVRLLAEPFVHGVFLLGIVRGGTGTWFHAAADVEIRYRCGRLTWRVTDPATAGWAATLEVVPLPTAAGFAVRFRGERLQAGDTLVWAMGGVTNAKPPAESGAWLGNLREQWDPVYCGNPNIRRTGDPCKAVLRAGFDPAACRGNRVSIDGDDFRILPEPGAKRLTVGACDRRGNLRAVDAAAISNPAALAASTAADLPLACGAIPLRAGQDELFWAVEAAPADAAVDHLACRAPAQAFAGAVAAVAGAERVETTTPEPRLDAAVAAVGHAIDAARLDEPPVFLHGCMAWAIPFVGWRIISGSTACGWHDRVRANAAHYFAHQVREDAERTRPCADPTRRLTHEGPASRFHGRGKIANSPGMYNTQTQFFDQTIRDWRATADPELERLLRPALERHLDWARECFDPDDDGLYESYINTLPSDSVWYNGGGSAEESAYAYYGHLAARDLARRAGDPAAAARHQARADQIQRAMREQLWLRDRGHFGAYREQGGQHRVHPDAWVYSQFLPIDAGLGTPEEAIQALSYTEWALERIPLPYGGTICQASNWVPSKWSVRDVFNGDVWALALAYDQLGLADAGWELFRGAMLETCYASAVPGGFSHIGAGTDFSDCKDMFARVVVEGLFGYAPDYPNDIVRVRPALPSTWPHAAIRTPDCRLAYRRDDAVEQYELRLTRPAVVEFRLLVSAATVTGVTIDGNPSAWRAEPGFGCTHVIVRTTTPVTTAVVEIRVEGRVPASEPVAVTTTVGASVRLVAAQGRVTAVQDCQGIFAAPPDLRLEGPRPRGPRSPEPATRQPTTEPVPQVTVAGEAIRGTVAAKAGHHLVLANVTVGSLPQRQIFKVHVTDPAGEAARAARTPRTAPANARWECLDLTAVLNGDVRTIFQQQYVSPRPATCSVRIGVDGWSAWTMAHWGDQPPAIDLGGVPALVRDGRLQTPAGAPFVPPDAPRNIAFTSLWDNWPRSVCVPVSRAADAVWLLVCGSTNPMQLRLPNATVRFRYADGQTESLDLVPPFNFWSLASWGGCDYSYETDAFALAPQPPPMVQLGNDCRAMVLSWTLRPGVALESVTLETLSQEVVIGLMGVSLMNPPPPCRDPRYPPARG